MDARGRSGKPQQEKQCKSGGTDRGQGGDRESYSVCGKDPLSGVGLQLTTISIVDYSSIIETINRLIG